MPILVDYQVHYKAIQAERARAQKEEALILDAKEHVE